MDMSERIAREEAEIRRQRAASRKPIRHPLWVVVDLGRIAFYLGGAVLVLAMVLFSAWGPPRF